MVDLIGCLVNRPFVASHTTASPLFRLIEMVQPTILLDEVDAYLRNNEEARAIINAGHKRGAMVMRSVGDEHEPRGFSVFAPMVIAGIGKQAETVEDRSIIIELKRKKPNERTESFRTDRAGEADVFARKSARWAKDNSCSLTTADPSVPDGLYNRAADNWRPLLAVADAIGGRWPEQARAIASSMIKDDSNSYGSLGVQLLRDIRTVFSAKGSGSIWSNNLANALRCMPDRPWAELRGTGLTPNTLARRLEGFGILPRQVRIGDKNNRGYRAEQFTDAFERICPLIPPWKPLHRYIQAKIIELRENQTATPAEGVAVGKSDN